MFGIRDVEVLRAVVRHDGFRAAAAALGLSQSAVSNRVAGLEAALGVPLFDRSRRKARLTPEGRQFLEEAEALVALRDGIAARYAAGEGGGTLRLGVAETIVHTGVARFARRLRGTAPRLRIELAVEASPALATALAAGELDVAVMMTAFVPSGAQSRPFGKFDLGWYAAPDEYASDTPLDAAALARRGVVTFAHGTLPHREVARLLSGTEAGPPLLHGSASLATVLTMVADGVGVGTLPRAVAAEAVGAGRIRELAVAPALRLSPLVFSLAWFGTLPGGVEGELDPAIDPEKDRADHPSIG